MSTQNNLAQHTNFKVILDGVPLGFSKVSNVSATMEYETVAEGGLNDRVHYLPKPRQNLDKLTLEYGIASGDLLRTTLTAGSVLSKGGCDHGHAHQGEYPYGNLPGGLGNCYKMGD